MRSFKVPTVSTLHDASSPIQASRVSNFIQAARHEGRAQSKGTCGCGGGCRTCMPSRRVTSGGPRASSAAARSAVLTVRPADDRYEQEADRVAQAVVRAGRMNEPLRERITSAQPLIQRQADEEQEEEPYREAPEPIGLSGAVPQEEEELPVQRKEARSRSTPPPVDTRATGGLARGGRKLPGAMRHAWETRLGSDFSNVRIHTDAKAAQWAARLQARAFTYGRHIHFAAGAYRPGREAGIKLLAHELTHVIQQGQAPRRGQGGGEGIHPADRPGGAALHEPVIQRSLAQAYSNFDRGCECGEDLGNNCAHYLSDALIEAGYSQLDGGSGGLYRRRNGRVVCKEGRPVRAAELRDWFASQATQTEEGEPDANSDYWAVFQERRSDGQDHVLIHKHEADGTYSYRGTGDYPGWKAHQTHYTW